MSALSGCMMLLLSLAGPINGEVTPAEDVTVANQTLPARCVAYELQEGSTLSFNYWDATQNDFSVVTVNLRGGFCRCPTNIRNRYALRGVDFVGYQSPTAVTVTGSGVYQAYSPISTVPTPEWMRLSVDIIGFPQPSDIPILLVSANIWEPQGAFPTIIIDLAQVSTVPEWYYTAHLIATPRRYIDFSTETDFEVLNPSGTDQIISEGDLLRDTGLVLRTNRDLMRNFGIMPPIPPVGLDAVDVCRWCPATDCPPDSSNVRRCVLFSIEERVWSEALGRWLGEGDVLCECGTIIRTNAQLIQAFHPVAATADVGLDALYAEANGTFWFSTEVGFWGHTSAGIAFWVSPDDLLSDQGYVVKSNTDLLQRFHPIGPIVPFGLDAATVLSNREVYFSVEAGFMDLVYGPVSAGDLLSDAGYIVARNRELIAGFHPSNTTDAGLDAVMVGPDQACPVTTPTEVDPADVEVAETQSGTGE